MKRIITLATCVAVAAALAFSTGYAATAAAKHTAAAAHMAAKADSGMKSTATAAPKAAKAAAAREMLDINSASKEDLMKLPGVADAISDKIIAGRPYKTKMELLQKGIVNRPTYAKLRGLIIAKQK